VPLFSVIFIIFSTLSQSEKFLMLPAFSLLRPLTAWSSFSPALKIFSGLPISDSSFLEITGPTSGTRERPTQ
jgi:hypothetical protein